MEQDLIAVESLRRDIQSPMMIDAESDRKAITLWLADYVGTNNTLQSYRKESDRFMLWLNSQNKTLKDLTRESVLSYRRFIMNPTENWISSKKYPRDDPRWKPFTGPLSAASVRQTENILSHMYSWLTKAGYVKSNPFALTSKKIRTGSPIKSMRSSIISRHINEELWDIIIKGIDTMPADTDRLLMAKERCRWLVTLLKSTGLRATEACSAKFNEFRKSKVKKGDETISFWMLDVVGKGGKHRTIPIKPSLLEAAERYCDIMNKDLYDLVNSDSDYPLIMPLNGNIKKHLSRAALHLLIKQICNQALPFATTEEQIEKLNNASLHWLRHTAGSSMANNGTDVRVIKEILGHASLETSSIYLHLEDDLALYDGLK